MQCWQPTMAIKEKYEKAMHHYFQAIEGFKKSGDKLKLAVAYNHLSHYMRDEKQIHPICGIGTRNQQRNRQPYTATR